MDRFSADFGQFWVGFGGFWRSSGNDLGVFWGGPGHVLFEKKRLIYIYIFSKNLFFEDRWGVCSFLRRIRPSGSGPNINFNSNYDSGPAGPDWGLS